LNETHNRKILWLAVFALLLCTRVPVMSKYLSIDNVNLAFSLEKFDPRIHQPQPPGYPFFVLSGRVVNFFFHDAERTFVVISLLVTGLCLPLAFVLGRRMFSAWAGIAAALLLLVNPVFWQAGIEGPLRPYLAFFSLLTAYCCWRCWNGEERFAFWGAVALGVGGGFRPDLIAFLFPLWLVSAWAGTKSWRATLYGLAAMTGVGVVWIGSLVWAMGGVGTFMKIMLDYAGDQSRAESIVLGSPIGAWLRQVDRLAVWNALAVITWIWAVPLYFRNKARAKIAGANGVFFLVWVVPGLLVQALVHVGAPGHTLHSVAALCVLGGYFLSLVPARNVLLGTAVILNTVFFFNFFTPRDAAMFESSVGQVQLLDEVTGTTLKEIAEFTPKDRMSVIVTTDKYVTNWFMNWRIGRYYLPTRDFWVLSKNRMTMRVDHIRRDLRLESKETLPLRVPLFSEGRILWLVEPGGAIYRQLAATQKLNGGKYVFYTDLTPDSQPFMISEFEVAPSSFNVLRPDEKRITLLLR
jgi:hypothetical protein